MSTVLITGGTGLLGQALIATAPPHWSIVSTHLRAYSGGNHGVVEVRADVRSRAAVERLFFDHRFDAVIHAAGIASVDESERDPAASTVSNVDGTRHVAERCRAAGARLIYVSTNAVFGGSRAPYRETDPVDPVNAYGRVKVACEDVVRATVERHLIVRPILMYGWPHAMGRPNPVSWVVGALQRGETIHVVNDVVENPIHDACAAAAVWAALDRDVGGVVHLAGRDVVTRYEMALAVARVFDLDPSRIRPVPSSYFPSIAPRPSNTTLITERMEAELGVAPSRLDGGLRRMAAGPRVGA